MRSLIDANILLDVLLGREPHYRDSAVVWKLCESERVAGYVSALTIANLRYVMRRELDPDRVADVVNRLSLIFRIADLTASDIARATALKWPDFEDALQSVTAERLRADCIITRNVRDFTRSRVIALTPAEFLARLS